MMSYTDEIVSRITGQIEKIHCLEQLSIPNKKTEVIYIPVSELLTTVESSDKKEHEVHRSSLPEGGLL